MSEVEKVYECIECTESFTIIWRGKTDPEHCPFCGAFIEAPEEDEDNWD